MAVELKLTQRLEETEGYGPRSRPGSPPAAPVTKRRPAERDSPWASVTLRTCSDSKGDAHLPRAKSPPQPQQRALPMKPRGRAVSGPAAPRPSAGARQAAGSRPYQILQREAPEHFHKMAGRKVLIVYAHQEPKSMNGSLKEVAVEELSKQGCSVTVSDLYAMQFEPRATRNDIVGCLHNSEEFNYGMEAWEAYKRGGLSDDVIEEQKKVQEADLLIFQFPLYWFSMPAIMKGWMDRVLVQGFAHEFPNCYDSGLLKNKLALFSFTTGASKEMYAKGGISGDIRYLLWPMQHGIMHFCGVQVLAPHICFAPEYVSEEKRKEMLNAWAQRLKSLWKEEPINCSPEWYFK